MIVTLPYPPSANRYWRHNRGRTHLSSEAKAYRVQVLNGVRGQTTFGSARLSVAVDAYPPDRRRRDLDNILKQLLDALQYAGIYEDDSQIDELVVIRREKFTGGKVQVEVKEHE